jgi:hypothetical protein
MNDDEPGTCAAWWRRSLEEYHKMIGRLLLFWTVLAPGLVTLGLAGYIAAVNPGLTDGDRLHPTPAWGYFLLAGALLSGAGMVAAGLGNLLAVVEGQGDATAAKPPADEDLPFRG